MLEIELKNIQQKPETKAGLKAGRKAELKAI